MEDVEIATGASAGAAAGVHASAGTGAGTGAGTEAAPVQKDSVKTHCLVHKTFCHTAKVLTVQVLGVSMTATFADASRLVHKEPYGMVVEGIAYIERVTIGIAPLSRMTTDRASMTRNECSRH